MCRQLFDLIGLGVARVEILAALVVAHDVLIHAAGQMVIAAPVGSLGDPRNRAAAGSLAASLSDRATITSMTGFLRRRVGDRLTTAQCKRMSLLGCYAGTFLVQDLGPALADFLHERCRYRLDGSLTLWGQGMTTRIEIDQNDTEVIVRVTDDNGRDQTATMPCYPHRGSDMYTEFADALDVMMYTWERKEEK